MNGYTWISRTSPRRALCTICAVRKRFFLRMGGIAGSGATSGPGVVSTGAAGFIDVADVAELLMVSHSPCEAEVRR